jgi:hypothetical protein
VQHRNRIGIDCDARGERVGQNSKPGLIGRAWEGLTQEACYFSEAASACGSTSS